MTPFLLTYTKILSHKIKSGQNCIYGQHEVLYHIKGDYVKYLTPINYSFLG